MDGLEQQVDGPLAGAELAVDYLLSDASFGDYARRTAAGITRARVSEPMLAALVSALWRSREGMQPRALAVVVADDDAARSLAESAAAYLPSDTAAFLPSRGVGWGAGSTPRRTSSASATMPSTRSPAAVSWRCRPTRSSSAWSRRIAGRRR